MMMFTLEDSLLPQSGGVAYFHSHRSWTDSQVSHTRVVPSRRFSEFIDRSWLSVGLVCSESFRTRQTYFREQKRCLPQHHPPVLPIHSTISRLSSIAVYRVTAHRHTLDFRLRFFPAPLMKRVNDNGLTAQRAIFSLFSLTDLFVFFACCFFFLIGTYNTSLQREREREILQSRFNLSFWIVVNLFERGKKRNRKLFLRTKLVCVCVCV